MRLLVTGGAGYIGSVVTHRLLMAGHRVLVLDDFSSGHLQAVPSGAEVIVGGMSKAAGLLTTRGPFDGVVHLAARSLIDDSVRDPRRYWHGNIVETLILLDAMRSAGVPRIVFSSTAAVYGQPRQVPISEGSPTVPTNPYGDSKLAVDLMLSGYARAYQLGAVSLRYFNVAGAVDRYGERHEPETHLIPLALRASLDDGPPFRIYGIDYPTPDGTCVRDFVHVADIADAHLAALERIVPGRHRIYNLGNGRGFSVLEVLAALEEVTGRQVPRSVTDRRPGDPAILVASGALAHDELGWQPARPTLHEMISDARQFHQRWHCQVRVRGRPRYG